MNELAFLTWVRGPGLNIAIAIFVLGLLWRVIEILAIGRKKELSEPRRRFGASGLFTLFRRFVPPPGAIKQAPVTYIGGYVFHIGLAIIVLLFAPHILVFTNLIGLSWPALPSPIIDLVSIITMAAMIALLLDRLIKPAKRFLSTFEDWLTWTLTFVPILTGWLAVQHLLLPYTWMLALHILSVELLLIALPFTKLFHAVSFIGSRWYNGKINGHKGVPV